MLNNGIDRTEQLLHVPRRRDYRSLVANRAFSRAPVSTPPQETWSPNFAVVIPVFDDVIALGRSLESVRNQRLRAVETTVIDDASTIDMTEMLRELSEDGVLVMVQHENRGPAAARNLGARTTTADWLVFLDSDDELLPGALATFAAAAKPDCGLVRAKFTLRDHEPDTAREGFLAGTFAISRRLFEAVGGYDEELRYSENSELLTRLTEALPLLDLRCEIVDQATVAIKDAGRSRNYDDARMRAAIHLLAKHPPARTDERARLEAIAAVNAARTASWGEARHYAWAATRSQPRITRHYLRLALVLLGPVANQYWHRGEPAKAATG